MGAGGQGGQGLCPRRHRRQGPVVHSRQGAGILSPEQRRGAGQRQVSHRGRRRGLVAEPDALYRGEPGPAQSRRLRDQRHLHGEHRRAVDHPQSARHDLHRGRSRRPQGRPAQRAVGRRRAQPGTGIGRNVGQALQRRQHHRRAWLLRRCGVADRRRARHDRQDRPERGTVQGGHRRAGAVGRQALHHPRAALRPPDAGHQRPVERLERPRPQDDHSAEGGRQAQLAAGRQPGPAQDFRSAQKLPGVHRPADGEARGAPLDDGPGGADPLRYTRDAGGGTRL